MGSLAQAYRRFAADAAATSPLHACVAVALGESDDALRALGEAPAGSRRPALVLAALHDLALAGRAPALAEAYGAADRDAAARAAVETLLSATDAVVALAQGRRVTSTEPGGCTALYPAVAEAARRAGARSVGLVGVDCSARLDLHLDRVAIAYGVGPVLGDATSAVRLSAAVVGERPVPSRAVPEVVARVAVGRDPVDVTDEDDVRWLRACLPPDQPAQAARLQAQLALAAAAPAVLLRGDVVDLLPDALDRVPADALPVLTTAWALSALPRERRLRLARRLQDAAAGRLLAWVSVEGVGVAPGVQTLGDRPASGHSTVGVTVLDGTTTRADAVGRCWGRGRWLSWLADS